MSLPPLPKNFASAVDLSSLGKPAAPEIPTPGIAVTQANLVSEVLPASNQKVVILICWSPRSTQAISLLEVMGKYQEADLLENGEPAWILGTVNVDTEVQVAQALQIQSVPIAIAIIQEQMVPLFEAVPTPEQIRLVIDKVVGLAAERGVGQALEKSEAPEVPMEPEEIAAMEAMEKGDLGEAKAHYEKWLTRKPGDSLAKLGLAQTELILRVKDLDPKEVMTLASANPNEISIQLKAADVEIASGLNKSAFDRLIRLVKSSEGDEKKVVREHLLVLFALVDPSDPDLIVARRELASALY
ncbi:MAG: tetratricopeptide repeat protein [Actinobacteria bacterium]|nr:tetratricopeptide repeat protein [Actinomycetota bacterium]